MIVGAFGLQGSSKTTTSMLLGRRIAALLGATIYSNIKAPGVVHIARLSEYPTDRKNPKVLIVDEAMFSIDSRSFSEKNGIGWTQFIALLRKTQTLLLYATHSPGMVDIRLRQQTNYAIFCRSVGDHFEYLFFDPATDKMCKFKMKKQSSLWEEANFDTNDFPDQIIADAIQGYESITTGKRAGRG